MTDKGDLTVQAGCDGAGCKEHAPIGVDLEEGSDGDSVGRHPPTQATRKQNDKGSSLCVYFSIALAGFSLAALVLGFGIRAQRSEAKRRFELDAVDLVNSFEAMWNDYEMASLWGYQSGNSSGLFEREDFYETSKNLLSLGLEYEQMGYCVRVLHKDRAEYESLAKESYSKLFPGIPYFGMLAAVNDPNSPVGLSIKPREEKQVYYPCPYQVFPVDPRFSFMRAVDLQSAANLDVDESTVDVGQPVLSNTLTMSTPDNPEKVRFVAMLHPGRNRTFMNGIESLSMIIIRPDKMITKLLKSESLGAPLSAYVFDTTGNDGFGFLDLLGLQREIDPDIDPSDRFILGAHSANQVNKTDNVIETLPDTDIESVRKMKANMFEGKVQVGNREWTMILVSDSEATDLELGFVVLASSMILLVSCVLTIWLRSAQNRRRSLEQVRSQAEAEKTAVVIQNAKKKAENERELNDFMAHEVRNPLSAAMSACTFVASFLDGLEATKPDQAQKAAKEDVVIIDSSLHFINDLLRNMLDLHRATNGQLQMKEAAISVLDDVLRPVSNMLYTRGPNIQVLIDCPKNLVIESDRLRLTQIVLNLGRNSLKFVTEGFIRFRASMDEKSGMVVILVEDSGPGVPEEKRNKLFNKFQDSLDVLQQGTG